jgi:hypothetical protein
MTCHRNPSPTYNTSNQSFPPPGNHLCTYWNSVVEKEDEIKTGLEDTGQINLCYGCMRLMFSIHIEVKPSLYSLWRPLGL